MTDHGRVITLVCMLMLISASLILYGGDYGKGGHDKAEVFQEFACGFGIGASLNPKWGFLNFDPRIDAVDETVLFPVPGGYGYSPDTSMTVTGISEIHVERPTR